ncbi:MAG: GHKL domain-containing protein [Ruminococcus sp.]
MDLTILFANLLDNAIELAHHCRRKSERSSSSWNRKWASHHPYHQPLCGAYRCRTISTALPPGHMGVGLSNVRQTVEKYHGVFSVDTDAEVFAVAITIPVAQK